MVASGTWVGGRGWVGGGGQVGVDGRQRVVAGGWEAGRARGWWVGGGRQVGADGRQRAVARGWEAGCGLVLGKFGFKPMQTWFEPNRNRSVRFRFGNFMQTWDRLVSSLGNQRLPQTV